MATYKIGKKCEWKDIEVGEVFGNNGCFQVYIKTKETEAILLDTDEFFYESIGCNVVFEKSFYDYFRTEDSELRKLPKSTQELYYQKED